MIDDLTMRDYLKVSDYLRVSGDTISKYKNNFFWINDSQIVINYIIINEQTRQRIYYPVIGMNNIYFYYDHIKEIIPKQMIRRKERIFLKKILSNTFIGKSDWIIHVLKYI